MTMVYHSTTNRRVYFTRKRFFLTILLLNSFLGYVYFVHEGNQLNFTQNNTILTLWIDSLPIRKTPALQQIREILANEYNHEDLGKFYYFTHYEYSLGLKCLRNESFSERSELLKEDLISNKSISSFLSEHPLPINSSYLSQSRRFQRTDLSSYLIKNSDACLNESIDLLIIIISKSENYKIRDAIRRTWASGKNLGEYSSINVKFFFLLDLDEKLQHQIRLENDLFHDIIQVELPQQYTLVTYRVLSLFEWSFRYCRSAKFLFKTDDDIFINLLLLLKFVSPLLEPTINNSFRINEMHLYGYRHTNPIVFRSSDDPVIRRYLVTSEEYPCARYPDFLSGFGYLISRKARDAIVYTAYQDPQPFRISDVYLTGIIPDYLSIPRQTMNDFRLEYQGDCKDFFAQPNAFACAADFHYGNTTDIFHKFNQYWQTVRSQF